MFIDDSLMYEVIERCPDLFPEWIKENGQYWNRKTGEMITKDGIVMHDLVYREVVKRIKDWADNYEEQLYLFPMENIN